jgi:ABC-type glycerol-3-phosphate transport system permease component
VIRFLIPLLGIVILMSFFPLAVSLKDSFFHDIYGEKSFAGFDNYRYLFSDSGFWYSLGITVIWAVACTILVLLGGLVAALFLYRKGRFRRFFLFILCIPWGIPAYIAVPVWRALIHGNSGESLIKRVTGLTINLMSNPPGAFMATLWVSFWMALPFTTFLFVGHLRKIPGDILSAARIDGAGRITIVSEIVFPLLKPAFPMVAVLNLVKFIKDFTVIFLMTVGGPPLPQLITKRSILGLTTTAEVFLYDLFQTSRDIGIPSAFSFIMGTLILVIMLFWYRSNRIRHVRNEKTGYKRLPKRLVESGLLKNGAAILFHTGMYPLVFLVASGSILCLYSLFWMSFSKVNTTFIDRWVPSFFTASNYSRLFGEEQILRYYANSMFLSLTCALLLPMVTFGAAYAMTRISLRKQTAILSVVNLSTVLTGVHSLVPLYVFFRTFGLSDSYIPLILIYLSHSIPFSLLAIKTYLESFPSSFRELALLEGMTEKQYLLKVLFPLSLSPVATSMIHVFLNAWNGFLAPMIFLNDDTRYPLSLKLYTYVGTVSSGNPKWGLFSAASLLNILLIFLLFIPLKRSLFQSELSEYTSE